MALSELQIALIGAGTVAVALVWGYNLRQDRKHRQTAEKIFKGGDGDALLTGNAVRRFSPASGALTAIIHRLRDCAVEVTPMQLNRSSWPTIRLGHSSLIHDPQERRRFRANS